MTDPIEHKALEDVLDAYFASSGAPTADALTDWIRRYPEYERELADFAVAWSRLQSLPRAGRGEADGEALVQRGMSALETLLSEKRTDRSTQVGQPRPIAGLIAEGRTRRLSLDALAERLGLSASLVRKLDRRLIRYASIPLEVVEALSRAIEREVVGVARYLQGPATMAGGARYKAVREPRLADAQDFFDAVRDDPELSEASRRRWLDMEGR